VSLCRSDAASPQLVLGVHFAAMFVPACLAARHPAVLRMAPGACAALLAIGALALLFAPGASAWWALALAHGAAWSLAWVSQLQLRGAPAAGHGAVLAGAALNAALVLALGVGLAIDGMQTLTAWHVALGVAAGMVWMGRRTRQWRARAADA
jgi:hypothetical protein